MKYKSIEKSKNSKFIEPKLHYDNLKPTFAFTHLEIKDKKNCFSFKDIRITQRDYRILFENLNKISQTTWRKIKKEDYWAAHEVEWSGTACKGFTHLPNDYQNFPSFQFKALKEKRVFGFFRADNTFEIVCLDYDHKIYLQKR